MDLSGVVAPISHLTDLRFSTDLGHWRAFIALLGDERRERPMNPT